MYGNNFNCRNIIVLADAGSGDVIVILRHWTSGESRLCGVKGMNGKGGF